MNFGCDRCRNELPTFLAVTYLNIKRVKSRLAKRRSDQCDRIMQKVAVVHSLDLYLVCHAALRRLKLGLRARNGGFRRLAAAMTSIARQVRCTPLPYKSSSIPCLLPSSPLQNTPIHIVSPSPETITSTMASLSCKLALFIARMQVVGSPHDVARCNCNVFCYFHVKLEVNR
jgi:hypothetical protein